jgi:hypothetical protein
VAVACFRPAAYLIFLQRWIEVRTGLTDLGLMKARCAMLVCLFWNSLTVYQGESEKRASAHRAPPQPPLWCLSRIATLVIFPAIGDRVTATKDACQG